MAASPAAQETPFYKRMFSGVSDLFSPSSQPAETAPAAKPAPQKRAQAPSGIKVVSAD
jgi:hypothetical protein